MPFFVTWFMYHLTIFASLTKKNVELQHDHHHRKINIFLTTPRKDNCKNKKEQQQQSWVATVMRQAFTLFMQYKHKTSFIVLY